MPEEKATPAQEKALQHLRDVGTYVFEEGTEGSAQDFALEQLNHLGMTTVGTLNSFVILVRNVAEMLGWTHAEVLLKLAGVAAEDVTPELIIHLGLEV